MRVLLRQRGLYWTGGVTYKERKFEMTSDIRKAMEFKSREDASDNLLYWHDAGVGRGGDWEFVEAISTFGSVTLDQTDGWSAYMTATGDGLTLGCQHPDIKCQLKRPTETQSKLRTINQVCEEAKENQHSKMRLLQLQYELHQNSNKYSKVELSFMHEYIQEFLDEIVNNEIKQQMLNNFNDE